MAKANPIIVSICATILTSTAATASTLGTPIFTTAPATIFIVNEFGPFGRVLNVPFAPYDSYSISLNTTIDSSFGLPDLVGQPLEFSFGVVDGSAVSGGYSLTIGGTEVLSDPLDQFDSFLFAPPIASFEDSATPGNFVFEYAGVFAGFGPRDADFPEFEIGFQINQPLPLRTGFEQCNAMDDCEFSSDAPLSNVFGQPIVDSASYT